MSAPISVALFILVNCIVSSSGLFSGVSSLDSIPCGGRCLWAREGEGGACRADLARRAQVERCEDESQRVGANRASWGWVGSWEIQEGSISGRPLKGVPGGRPSRWASGGGEMATESEGEEDVGRLTGNQHLVVDDDLREMTKKAAWSVSSCKPGNGVLPLRDDNLETYWQFCIPTTPPPFPPLFSPFSSLSRFKWSTDLFFFLIPLLLVLSVSTGRRRASFSLSFRRSQIVDVFVQVWWRPTPFGKYTVSEEGQAPGTYSCYLFRFPPPSPSSTWSLLLNWWHLCLHSIQLLVLYVDFKVDESYTPSKISIRAGDGFHNLKVIPHSGKRYCAPIFSLS